MGLSISWTKSWSASDDGTVFAGSDLQNLQTNIAAATFSVSGQSQGDVFYYSGSAWDRLAAGTSGQVLKTQGSAANPVWYSRVGSVQYLIDGGGVEIGDGVAGDIMVPFACTITGVYLLADQSGSITIDIWKDTYANYPPTNTDTITAANEPAIASSTKDSDTTLTGWTTAITALDILRFNVDSCTTITRCLIILTYTIP